MDKLERKEVLKKIKDEMRKYGYKASIDTAYKRNGDLFYIVDYIFNYKSALIIEGRVKKIIHDDLLWEIMHLTEDGKLTDSLRAKGAFVTYALEVEKKIIENCNYDEEYLKNILDSITHKIDNFVKEVDISQYILQSEDYLSGRVLLDGDLLKCLVHCERGDIAKAKEIAMEQLEKKDTGRLNFKGKGFFEWMISYECK